MRPDLPWTLEDLVPHAAPMILLDDVRADGGDGLEGTVQVAEDSPFFEPGRGVPAYVGIEYVAQTVAALAGLRARRAGLGIEIGFLLGTRHFDAAVPYFPLGAALTVQVEAEYETRDIARYRGTVTDETGATLIDTSVTVFQHRGGREDVRIPGGLPS